MAASTRSFVAAVSGARAASAPLVAAASDLRFALDTIAAQHERETGQAVRIVYGSSGNFRRQIAEGAPFELFLSADEAYVLALSSTLAGNLLVVGVDTVKFSESPDQLGIVIEKVNAQLHGLF